MIGKSVRKGEDINGNIICTLEELYNGVNKKIKMTKNIQDQYGR